VIPPKTDSTWTRIVTGQLTHSFKCVPAGLMVARIQREMLAGGKNDPAAVKKTIEELHAFFEKYEPIMQDDNKALFGQ